MLIIKLRVDLGAKGSRQEFLSWSPVIYKIQKKKKNKDN